jgi:hypothetical protein
MSRRRKLILGAIAALVSTLLMIGPSGYRSYHTARRAADQYVTGATDGPWVRWKTRFVVDFEPSGPQSRFAPRWVFRYRNPRSGEKSRRVYVTVTGDRAFSYQHVLDPVPLLGFRP